MAHAERDRAQRVVEREPDEACEHQQEQDEAEDDDPAAKAVRADLLLERHVARENDTCGGAVSPCAEKNSLARKPKGLAISEPGDALDRRVEVHDCRVVVAPGRADLVLRVGEILLELQEVLGRLELGIRLGDGEQASERGA